MNSVAEDWEAVGRVFAKEHLVDRAESVGGKKKKINQSEMIEGNEPQSNFQMTWEIAV